MPNCPSGCLFSFRLPTQTLTFRLELPAPEVYGFAAGPTELDGWDQAAMDRLAAKLQAFHDALSPVEQLAIATLLERAATA
jgi:hypothetical protein